jgi:hypothetical protein
VLPFRSEMRASMRGVELLKSGRTMSPKPDALVKADYLLQQSETVSDHERRAGQIKEAFDLLKTYLHESPATEHREYIENRKQS